MAFTYIWFSNIKMKIWAWMPKFKIKYSWSIRTKFAYKKSCTYLFISQCKMCFICNNEWIFITNLVWAYVLGTWLPPPNPVIPIFINIINTKFVSACLFVTFLISWSNLNEIRSADSLNFNERHWINSTRQTNTYYADNLEQQLISRKKLDDKTYNYSKVSNKSE